MAKRAASSVLSVMRHDLDAATSTMVDVHEAQWRAGVNRQAQPEAVSHQLAASRAAAAKRKANAMTGEDKAAAQRRNADKRNEAKRAKRAAANAAAAEATEATAASDAMQAESDADSADDGYDGDPSFDEFDEILAADGVEPIDEEEYVEFREWCSRHSYCMDAESFADWYHRG